jgi:hypothetical protein
MSVLRFRLLGSRADADDVIARVHGIENIEHVEELDALEPITRDDSSSSESVADNAGHAYVIEVETPNDEAAAEVRLIAEACAAARNAGIEYIGEF